MKLKSVSIIVAITLLILSGCDPVGDSPMQPGQITFSFAKKDADGSTGGRANDLATIPKFASYSIRKSDNSLISEKIELFEFNGDFVSSPQQMQLGHYTLGEFLILNAANQILYASPTATSPLASLVEHPLPLEFDITANAVTNLIPEVLALADHTPEEFGYAKFGFEVVEKFDFNVATTIADNDYHSTIDYTLEIIAKDAPLGNVLWTKTLAMGATGEIHIPAKYAHYTFKASKQGYIDHVQHYLNADLSQFDHLYFEFLPEGLNDFYVRELGNSAPHPVLYMTKSPCKLYARVDAPEGYQLIYQWADRNAEGLGQEQMADFIYYECADDSEFQRCDTRVNLYNNLPYAMSDNYCDNVVLNSSTPTLDDVLFYSFIYVDYIFEGNAVPSLDVYTHWQNGTYDGVPH